MSSHSTSDDRIKYGEHLSQMAAFIKSLPPREQSAIANREPVERGSSDVHPPRNHS